MSDSSTMIAGLRTVVVETVPSPRLIVVMLHGYAMDADTLAPFARSLGIAARFLVPQGPVSAEPTGRAWWALDLEARAREMAAGPRDLARAHPAGAPAARATLVQFRREIGERWPAVPVTIVGFSQGGMLACDALLRDGLDLAALALLSSSRIAFDEWQTQLHRLRDLPVFVSHGERDPDLAFAAGEALRDMAEAGGAQVTWLPFDGGHEIPLVVWRGLKKFLGQILRAT